MHIENSYSCYRSKLNDIYQTSLLYRGEFIARRICNVLEDGSRIWALWEDGTFMECCRLCRAKDNLDITEVCRFPNFLLTDEAVSPIFQDKASVSWLNLCHFRSKDGNVHYDKFYDRYPTGDNVKSDIKSIGTLRTRLSALIGKYMPFTSGDTVYIDGSLGIYNILQDLLSKAGLAIFGLYGMEEDDDIALQSQMGSANIGYIDLFTVQLESITQLRSPENKDVIVYVEARDRKAEGVKEEIQMRHSHYDLLGNRWLTIQKSDGSTQCSHYTKSNITFTEVAE